MPRINPMKGFLSLALLALAVAFLVESLALSEDFGPFRKRRAAPASQPLARCVTETGSMLVKKAGDYQWRVVSKGDEFCPGDTILSGAGSQIENRAGTVRVTFRGDLAGNSPLPIRETVATIFPINDSGIDFALGFERGRVEFTNLKEKGAATVTVNLLDEEDSSTVKLLEPDSSCALEILGTWPGGVHFDPKAAKPAEPSYELIYVVLKGKTEINDEGVTHILSAPPGPAMLRWNSHSDNLPVKLKLEKLPAWASPPDRTDPVVQQRLPIIMDLRAQFASGKGIDDVLDEMVQSGDEAKRYLAMNLFGAMDRMDKIAQHVNQTKYHDVIDNSVIVLRHWIGRKAGQADLIFKFLTSSRQYTPAQAEVFVNLLHSFSTAELRQPETYEILMDYMGSQKTGIRGLAHWHLERLVPKGKEISFNPAAPVEIRKQALEKWRKLVPKGKVPPRTLD
ncbi:MAG: hypothetical protein EXR99_11870 [Gemmataceae bacterium]|nr:hypothetical protein [Gemmataceae bacterium]